MLSVAFVEGRHQTGRIALIDRRIAALGGTADGDDLAGSGLQ